MPSAGWLSGLIPGVPAIEEPGDGWWIRCRTCDGISEIAFSLDIEKKRFLRSELVSGLDVSPAVCLHCGADTQADPDDPTRYDIGEYLPEALAAIEATRPRSFVFELIVFMDLDQMEAERRHPPPPHREPLPLGALALAFLAAHWSD